MLALSAGLGLSALAGIWPEGVEEQLNCQRERICGVADLVVGRSGAVSVAEYAAAGVPSVCIPYPYHKDRHQYLNAEQLVEAGAAVVVDDLPNTRERGEWLAESLVELMGDDGRLREMRDGCRQVARVDGGLKVAERLVWALG